MLDLESDFCFSRCYIVFVTLNILVTLNYDTTCVIVYSTLNLTFVLADVVNVSDLKLGLHEAALHGSHFFNIYGCQLVFHIFV